MQSNAKSIELKVLLELSMGSPVGQLRAIPVSIEGEQFILCVYSAEFEVDPYLEMFYFPEDTLKMALFDLKGEFKWKKDLGKGVVPGIWFCPVFAFDLDGDGTDEIWFVNNSNPSHQLSLKGYCLERLDSCTGQSTGQWQWPYNSYDRSLSSLFRNFIMGGYVKGKPVLVTAQGTYGDMYLQGWNADMSQRWKLHIDKEEPGARGSHVTPVVDINNDGIDELMWGERCIELDRGKELFCCDRELYRGHSDLVQPVYNQKTGRWFIYTAREQDNAVRPRVALFDDAGNRIWGAVEYGHMDMNWVASIPENINPVAMSIRIGEKVCGPDGRYRSNCEQFVFDAFTGEPRTLSFEVYASLYGRLPVDINGDGFHEFLGNGELIDSKGHLIGNTGGEYALLAKLMDHPGEQVVVYYKDGKVRVWGDVNAQDSDRALKRYENPFYQLNRRLTGVGYNLMLLGGI